MKKIICFVLPLFIFLSNGEKNMQEQNELQTAKLYFEQLEQVLNKDNGQLWGVSMYAPTFFVNPKTRVLYANQQSADSSFSLYPETGVYVGTFPKNKNTANSTLDLNGKKWVMAMWPLPEDDLERNVLLVHETFHYHQPQLGLSPIMATNNHFDQLDARLWLKMEWNALEKAIEETDTLKRHIAIQDALQFRAKRRELFSEAFASENAFEILEGLPNYTAYTICYSDKNELQRALKSLKEEQWKSDSYIYSFAYYSGCAYGYLLDREDADWRKELKEDADLANLLKDAVISSELKTLAGQKTPYGKEVFHGNQAASEQRPPAENRPPARNQAASEQRPPAENRPPVGNRPLAENRPPVGNRPPAGNVDPHISEPFSPIILAQLMQLAQLQYGYDSVFVAETQRKTENDRIVAAYQHTFLEDTVLVLPLVHLGIGFSPANLKDLSPYGTIYPNIRITDDFGIVELSQGGCLISSQWDNATIPWAGQQKGDWTITLKEGYAILPPLKEEPLQYRIGRIE